MSHKRFIPLGIVKIDLNIDQIFLSHNMIFRPIELSLSFNKYYYTQNSDEEMIRRGYKILITEKISFRFYILICIYAQYVRLNFLFANRQELHVLPIE